MTKTGFIPYIIVSAITILPIASAQELVILGYRVSFLLIAPLILLLIFLIIFGLVVLRDMLRENYGSIKAGIGSIKDALPKFSKRTELENISILEEEKKQSMDYIGEISKLKEDIGNIPEQEAYSRLMNIIRTFFSELLQIGYEFTFDELEKELKRKYKNIVFFSENLSELCYNSKGASRQKLLEVLNEFDQIARNAIITGGIREGNLFDFKLDNILLKNSLELEEQKQSIENTKSYLKPKEDFKEIEKGRKEYERNLARRKKVIEEEKRIKERIDELKNMEMELENKAAKNIKAGLAPGKHDKDRLQKLIAEGEKFAGKNIIKARELYKEIYLTYSNLPDEEKAKVYSKVMKLYDKIR